jgi:hypothetical protein
VSVKGRDGLLLETTFEASLNLKVIHSDVPEESLHHALERVSELDEGEAVLLD